MAAILFDLDGTLTDPFEGITRSLCYAMEQMGRTPPDRASLRWCIGPPIQEIIRTLLGTDDPGQATRCLAMFRERFSTLGLFENEPYPGIEGALQTLRDQGHRLFVATSKPRPFATRILDHFGLDRHFKGIYGSELDGTRTAKAEVIAHALLMEQLAPGITIMVGDRKHDVIGAHTNSVVCLGVTYGYGSVEELESAGADAICHTPGEIPASLAPLAATQVSMLG